MAKRTIPPELRSAQEKSFPTRTLKVRQGYYDYQLSNSSSTYRVPESVPWLHIKGYWLKKAGFPIGTAVRVKVYHGCLVIKATQISS